MSIEKTTADPNVSFDAAHPLSSTDGRGVNWSRWLVWLSAALVVVVVSRNVWEAYQQRQRMRAVRCDEPVFDFGPAFIGDTIDHTFHVTNVSRMPLQIEKVRASCGCTTVATKLEGTSIGPDESFHVPVRLSLTGSEEGEFERPVMIRFAGEPRLEVTLELKGMVEKRWWWSAETVTFEAIQKDEVASRTIELSGRSDASSQETPRVVPPSTGLLRVDSQDVTTLAGDLSRQVTVTTVPPLPPGRRDFYLYAYTDGSAAPISPVRIILVVAE